MLYKKLIVLFTLISISINQIHAMEQKKSEKLPKDQELFNQILEIAQYDRSLVEYIKNYPQNPLNKIKKADTMRIRNLIEAIKCGITPLVQVLAKEFDDLNIEGNNNPLGHAVSADQIEIAKILIDAGADVNFIMKDNYSAIAYVKSSEMLKFLLFEHQAKIELGTVYKTNILMRLVIERGQDPKETPLSTQKNLIIELAKYLDINEPLNGITPLMQAVINNDLMMIYILLEAGADRNVRTEKGTAYELAVSRDYLGIADVLSAEDIKFS